MAGRARLLAVVLAGVTALATAQIAFAFDETGNTSGSSGDFEGYCYPTCHSSTGPFDPRGPHGFYTSTSAKCQICHSVHDASNGGILLLPAPTIVGTCFTCHDGTGGKGVYGAIENRTGVVPGAAHSYETTNLVPGGDAGTGGSSTMDFAGPGDTLICTDCHSPHGSDLVQPFLNDRARTENLYSYNTPKLLKRRPGGASVTVDEYGSDWCAACHAGRTTDGTVHNHPVETTVSAGGSPFVYERLAVIASDEPTSQTVIGRLGGRSNRGFLMPYPRTPEQGTHKPICQQCHEDSRRGVGSLSTDGSIADPWVSVVTTPDGGELTDNPRFQNFPHESVNAWFLVESEDDLCLNCHPLGSLP